MSWKKNTLSYLMWMIYTLITGTALVSLGSMLCVDAGIAAWWGILAAALYMGIVGGIVFLLQKTAPSRLKFAEKNHVLLLAAESVLATGLLMLGISLRISGMEEALGEALGTSVYFEMAEVAVGRQVPQAVHGAVYFYLQLLHGTFLLLGNQYMAGIWLQAGLQLAAFLVFYFVVRKLAGTLAALVTFFFCMCSPYIIGRGLVLSPGMLYFLLLVIAAALVLRVSGRKLSVPAMIFVGFAAAVCCYVDINGGLVLVLAAAIVFSDQAGKAAEAKRMIALGFCLLSAVLGLLFLFGADAFLTGKNFWKVAGAWIELYRPEGFRLPYVLESTGASWEALVVFGLMAFGIFGFWYDRKRDWHLPYTAAACIITMGCCFGIYTEELPGFYALYLMFAMLAGVSMEQCICRKGLPADVPDYPAENQEEAAWDGSRNVSTTLAEEGQRSDYHVESDEGRPSDFRAESEVRQRSDRSAKSEKEERSDHSVESEVRRRSDRSAEFEAGQRFDRSAESEVRQGSERSVESEKGQRSDRSAESEGEEEKKVRYLENPLPLPKKHVKRVLDYSIQVSGEDDFDFPVGENDDFDV